MNDSFPSSFGKFTIVVFVIPRGKVDMEAPLKLKTGREVQIHDHVESIGIRTALVLSPDVMALN